MYLFRCILMGPADLGASFLVTDRHPYCVQYSITVGAVYMYHTGHTYSTIIVTLRHLGRFRRSNVRFNVRICSRARGGVFSLSPRAMSHELSSLSRECDRPTDTRGISTTAH